jgi:hypothetical protein
MRLPAWKNVNGGLIRLLIIVSGFAAVTVSGQNAPEMKSAGVPEQFPNKISLLSAQVSPGILQAGPLPINQSKGE